MLASPASPHAQSDLGRVGEAPDSVRSGHALSRCRRNPGDRGDQTMNVLAILNQMLNLY